MYLKQISHLIYAFHDPIHVYHFQKYFGLQIIKDIDNYQNNQNHQHNHQNGKNLTNKKKNYKINNYFWYYLFSFGARLGYELFYAFSFSYLYWNIDSTICRKLMLVWAFLMYIGQALKDILKIPRPSGDNIIILEPEYSLEYGMPSTHAMLALMVPVTLYYILLQKYIIYSITLFIIFSIFWFLLICCSRLYLGMHSILDILVGALLTSILLIPVLPTLNTLDHFFVRNWISPLILIPLIILLSIFYPKSNDLSPSRADTITIISAFAGVYLGTWYNYHMGIMHPSPNSPILYPIVWPKSNEISKILIRTIMGLGSIFLMRDLGKRLTCFLIQIITGQIPDKTNKHQAMFEIPIKMISFLFAGLAISVTGPWLARALDIDRKNMYFEA